EVVDEQKRRIPDPGKIVIQRIPGPTVVDKCRGEPGCVCDSVLGQEPAIAESTDCHTPGINPTVRDECVDGVLEAGQAIAGKCKPQLFWKRVAAWTWRTVVVWVVRQHDEHTELRVFKRREVVHPWMRSELVVKAIEQNDQRIALIGIVIGGWNEPIVGR